MKQLLRDSDSSKTSLFERLENILRLWGEILSYICLVPPAVVERTSHLVKVTVNYNFAMICKFVEL